MGAKGFQSRYPGAQRSSRIVARTGGDAIGLKGEPALPLAELRAAHEAWLPGYMAAV